MTPVTDAAAAPEPDYAFDRETAVTARSSGVYSAVISDRWGVPGGNANGGYALSLCLRALRAELAHPDPLAVSMYYQRQVLPGPAEIHVDRGRTGRRLSFGEARLLTGGAEISRVVAAFGDIGALDGPTVVTATAPALPPVQDCIDLLDGAPATGVLQWLDFRYAERPGWHRGTPSGTARAEFWMRFADGRPADALSLPGMVDMAIPAVFEFGHFLSTTIELSVHVRGVPAPGWLACRVWTNHLQDGLHEEDFEIWDSAGTLVAQSRQLAMLIG